MYKAILAEGGRLPKAGSETYVNLAQKRRTSGRELYRRLLGEGICGNRSSMEELQKLWQEEGRFREYALLLVSSEEGFSGESLDPVLEECEERLGVGLISTWGQEGEVVLCVFREVQLARDYDLTALKVGNRIVERMEKEGKTVMVSISEVGSRPEEIRQLFDQTVFGRNSRFFLENQKVVHYGSLRSKSIRSEYEMLEHLEEFYVSCRQQSDKMTENLKAFLELLGQDESYDVEYVRGILVQTAIMMTCLVREKSVGRQVQKNVNEITKELAACGTVQEAFSWLENYAGELSGMCGGSRNLSPQGRRILDFMGENYAHHLALQDVADALKLSTTHICRTLKNDTGETFVTLLNKIRIQQAIKLLKEGELKVYEVAEQVGFRNYAYFYQLFRKETGCSPTEYK